MFNEMDGYTEFELELYEEMLEESEREAYALFLADSILEM